MQHKGEIPDEYYWFAGELNRRQELKDLINNFLDKNEAERKAILEKFLLNLPNAAENQKLRSLFLKLSEETFLQFLKEYWGE